MSTTSAVLSKALGGKDLKTEADNKKQQVFLELSFNTILKHLGKEKSEEIEKLIHDTKGEVLTLQSAEGYTIQDLAKENATDKEKGVIKALKEQYFPSKIYNKEFWSTLLWTDSVQFKRLVIVNNINPNYQDVELEALSFAMSLWSIPDFLSKLNFLIEKRNGNINLKHNTNFRNTLFSLYIANEQRQATISLLKFVLERRNGLYPFNPNVVDINKRSAFMLAIAFGQFDEFIGLLLKSKEEFSLDLNLQDKDGFTALHIACITRDLRSMILLIMHGASIEIKDNKGRTAFELLDEKYRLEYKALMDSIEINIQRDRKAESNNILISYTPKNIKKVFPIFTQTQILEMAEKFLNYKGKLTAATVRALGDILKSMKFMTMQTFSLPSNKDSARYNANELFFRSYDAPHLLKLDDPRYTSEKKEFEETLKTFSGETLEQYAFDPKTLAAAKRIISPGTLLELQQPTQLEEIKPILLTAYQEFRSELPQPSKSGNNKNSESSKNGNKNIADLISSYLARPKDISKFLAKIKHGNTESKPKKKKKRK